MSTATRRLLSSALKLRSTTHGSINSSTALSSSTILKNPIFSKPTPIPQFNHRLHGIGIRFYHNYYENSQYIQRSKAINLGIQVVREHELFIIERFGKFIKILNPGIHCLIPLVDRIAYIHSLKEQVIHMRPQTASTSDKVDVSVDGVLYLKVVDPIKASYSVDHPVFAMVQLAETSLLNAVGQFSFDEALDARETINNLMVNSINQASRSWGLECVRYETRKIMPPLEIREIMEKQAKSAQRKKAEILPEEEEPAQESWCS